MMGNLWTEVFLTSDRSDLLCIVTHVGDVKETILCILDHIRDVDYNIMPPFRPVRPVVCKHTLYQDHCQYNNDYTL